MDNKIVFKNKEKLSIIVKNGSYCHFEETTYILVKFTNFPVFKNTIKRILVAFEKRMERLKNFSLFYRPTLLPNLRLSSKRSFLYESHSCLSSTDLYSSHTHRYTQLSPLLSHNWLSYTESHSLLY